MKLEVFTLCDAATADQAGKLNLLGAFDTLFASTAPLTHPACAIAIRLRFGSADEGDHVMELRFVDSDGKQLLQPVKANIQIGPGNESRTLSRNFVLNFQQLKLPKFGEYTIDFLFDSQPVSSIPLYAVENKQP
jgi:hypothetical protein